MGRVQSEGKKMKFKVTHVISSCNVWVREGFDITIYKGSIGTTGGSQCLSRRF